MNSRAWSAFAALSVLWGIPYLFIKIAVDDGLSPAFVAWVRVVIGAVVLLTLAWRAGVLGQVRGHLRILAVYAVVEISIPFPLIAFGEQRVASSLAAILIAAVPLIVAILASRFDPSERANRTQFIGILVGLSGVIVLVGIDVAGRSSELVGALAVLVAAVGYSVGPMLMKHKLSGLDPRAAMGTALALAALVLTPFAAIAPPESTPTTESLVALGVLGLLCTAAGFIVFSVLILEAGPARAVIITYVNPVVAVALGVTILGERPGVGAVAGLLLILAGSWLSTDGRLPPGLLRRIEGTRARRGRGGPDPAPKQIPLPLRG